MMEPGTPVVHLDGGSLTGFARCGKRTKWLTRATSRVTCPECRDTWEFRLLARMQSGIKGGNT